MFYDHCATGSILIGIVQKYDRDYCVNDNSHNYNFEYKLLINSE